MSIIKILTLNEVTATMKIIEKFNDKIKGVLSGFDRMIIKGHLRQLFSDSGKRYFLSQEDVLLKDFGEYAEGITKTIKDHVTETGGRKWASANISQFQ